MHKIWIHAVWATFNQEAIISQNMERRLFDFMKQQFAELGCPVWAINGMSDHVHCLFLLSTQLSLSMLIEQIKGGSAHFVSQGELCKGKFAWQKGYAAYSLSEIDAGGAFQDISNQKQFHQRMGFREEFEGLLRNYHGNLGDLAEENDWT